MQQKCFSFYWETADKPLNPDRPLKLSDISGIILSNISSLITISINHLNFTAPDLYLSICKCKAESNSLLVIYYVK